MALYILLMSALRAMRCMRNLNKTSIREECMVGPTSKVSFNETPEEDFAEASNTGLILVVVLESLYTMCIGK